MRCFYINLDASTERKSSIEANFLKYGKSNWSLSRIPAIDTRYVGSHPIVGSISDAEKACFLSHKKAILEALKNDDSAFILEDDAVFGRKTCDIVENILANRNNAIELDVIFTDLIIPNIGAMANLLMLKHKLDAQNKFRLFNPKNLIFAGATAYILSPVAKRKLYGILDAQSRLDIPYDLFLRKLINQSKLSAAVVFPFVTSVSEFSNSSNIQPIGVKEASLIWDLYRQMVWIEGDFTQHRPIVDELNRKLSDEEKAFGILWAALARKDFKPR